MRNVILKEYQTEALESIARLRSYGADKALIVMASGLGKTVISAHDVDAFLHNKKGRMLFLCHDNRVLRQNMDVFKSLLGKKYDYGLYNCEEKVPNSRFLFASVKSIYLYKERFKKDEFAYIIIDEAHHAPAKMYQNILDYFQPKFLLGMTATPYRYDGISLEKTFGQIAYRLELPDAIKKGLLSKIDYWLVLDELIDLKAGIEEKELFKPKTNKEIAKNILEKCQEKSMLVFCSSIEHARIMQNLLPNSGIMHSECSRKHNQNTLKAFRRGTLSTIISVDMLNEGIDVPHTDAIVFLRSTASPVVYYQQLGRGLRKCPGKEKVEIYDYVGNIDRIKTVYRLVKDVERNQDITSKNQGSFLVKIEAQQFGNRKIKLDDIVQKINKISQEISIKQRMISSLRQLSKDMGGRVPTMQEFINDPWINYSEEMVIDKFQSWNGFLMAAGFDICLRKITRSETVLVFKNLGKRMLKTRRAPTSDDLVKEVGSSNYDYLQEKYFDWWSILDSIFEAAGLKRITEAINSSKIIQYQQFGIFLESDFEKVVGSENVDLYISVFGSWENFHKKILFKDDQIRLLHVIESHPWPTQKGDSNRLPTPGELVKALPPYFWEKYKLYYGKNMYKFIYDILLISDKFDTRRMATMRLKVEKNFIELFKNSAKELSEAKLVQFKLKRYRKEIVNRFGSWENFLDCARNIEIEFLDAD